MNFWSRTSSKTFNRYSEFHATREPSAVALGAQWRRIRDQPLRMRKKERPNILERIKARLLTFGNKHQHSPDSPFLQFQVDWLKSGGTGIQRSTDNLWDRSLYSAGTESPANHNEQNRRRRLDTQDDDHASAGTSGASSTPRRRLSTLPSFAKPPQPADTPRGKRLGQQSRKRPSLSPVPEHDEEDQPTQLYTRAPPDKRRRTTDRRRAAATLPTTFDDEQEEEEQTPRAKNKRPLTGPATAKNRQPRHVRDSTSDKSDEEDQPPKRPNKPEPKQKPKRRKRPAVVVADDSDMEDDELGITPRTPPDVFRRVFFPPFLQTVSL